MIATWQTSRRKWRFAVRLSAVVCLSRLSFASEKRAIQAGKAWARAHKIVLD